MSLEQIKSDKRFIARLKEDNQGFQIEPHWLQTFTLYFSMFQNMLGPLWPNLDTSGIKWPRIKTGKTENLRSIFFRLFSPVFLIAETSTQYYVERCTMLCNIV